MEIAFPHVFKRYDIRGRAGTELTPDLMEALGRAVGTYLRRRGKTDLVAGRDGRLTGEEYAGRFMKGAAAAGLLVHDLGLCPTPAVYFALHSWKAGGAAVVTASHNPPQYNGLKLCCGTDTLFDDSIQDIRRLVESEDFDSGDGRVIRRAVLYEYLDDLQERFGEFSSRPRVVVDAGNGTAGLVAPELFRRLKCRVAELYCSVDGRFPHHEADPTVEENLRDLIRLVREQKADLGIAFDGDSDRIGVVDGQGRILHGDQLLLLYARAVLADHPGATIISEVKSSRILYDEIAQLGGNPVMWVTGHSLIKARMKETGALLAGEMSGHMFFADRYFGFDDAIYAALRLLEIIERTGRSLAELRDSIPATCNTPEIRVDCPEEAKQPLVSALLERYRRDFPVVDIDGLRVSFPEGWGLVRASHTQPILVLRFEANSSERLAEIRGHMEAAIAEEMVKLGLV